MPGGRLNPQIRQRHHGEGHRPALAFLERINQSDPEGLGRLMSDDHQLLVFDEEPVRGKSANILAWRGYFAAFPRYRIVPQRVSDQGSQVAILGHAIGSHLRLSDEDEARIGLIWVARVEEGKILSWRLLPDTPEERRSFGLHLGTK